MEPGDIQEYEGAPIEAFNIAPKPAIELINAFVEEARTARREAAANRRADIAALHSSYIDKLTAIKVKLGEANR